MTAAFVRRFGRFTLVAAAATALASCGINSVPTSEENAKAKWADVESAYQRRADLVPNLVEAMFTDFPGNSGETVRISVAPEKNRRN